MSKNDKRIGTAFFIDGDDMSVHNNKYRAEQLPEYYWIFRRTSKPAMMRRVGGLIRPVEAGVVRS